jgi:hypothetical protein
VGFAKPLQTDPPLVVTLMISVPMDVNHGSSEPLAQVEARSLILLQVVLALR